MKATEQYFPVVLFIMLHKVVLTFESVHEILKCDHSNECNCAVLSCSTLQLLHLWMKCYSVTIQTKATEQYFHVVLFINVCCTRWF